MCHCRTNADRSVVVCDSCAARMMTALLGLLPEQDAAHIETPTLLTSVEHRGMMSVVNGWLDTLQPEGVQA